MGDSGWVEDFSQFKDSHSTMGLTGRPGKTTKKVGPSKSEQTRADKIKAELKLLEWHKLANDAALKAALMQTKSLRTDIPQVKPKHVADDAKWIKKVIEQEHMKSLEVSKDYVMRFEAKEKEQQDRASEQIQKKIETLGQMRERFESKVHLKKTTNEYREFQRNFSEKKWAILKGQTLDDYEAEKIAKMNATGPATDDDGGNDKTQARIPPPSDLTNVLESLNKLAALEKRITHLEGANEYEKMNMRNRIPVQERTSFEFKKKPSIGNGVKKIVYTVKPKRTAFGNSSSGAGANAVRGIRGGGGRDSSGGDGGGTFLTGGDFGGGTTGGGGNAAMTREDRMKQRRRDLEKASAGQKSMRNRIMAKKTKMKESQIANKRHNEAMDELQRRRRDTGAREKGRKQADTINNRNKPPGRTTGGRTTKGASAGIRHKNKHMQEFNNIKGAHQKRREDMIKKTLNRVNKKGKDTSAFRAGGAYDSNYKSRQARGDGGLQSQSATAPVGVGRGRGGGGGRGVSKVRGGTNTRRSMAGSVPTRRVKSGGAEMPLNNKIVGGIGGVRALRNNNNNANNDMSRNNRNNGTAGGAMTMGLSIQGMTGR